MTTVRELLPAGLGVVAAGVVAYLALDRGWSAGPWLLGLLLLGHGARWWSGRRASPRSCWPCSSPRSSCWAT